MDGLYNSSSILQDSVIQILKGRKNRPGPHYEVDKEDRLVSDTGFKGPFHETFYKLKWYKAKKQLP